jgi:hypothetical protein
MKTRNSIISIILFLSVFFLFVSCGQQKSEWKGTTEVVNGITVVKNPKEPIHGEDVFRIEQDLTIGEQKTEEELIFQNIYDFVVDDEENIYISDSKAGHIVVFDKKGNHVKTIGSKGQGPGELLFPSEIHVFPQGMVMVQDIDQGCVHFYSSNGEFLRKQSLHTLPFFDARIDSKGNIIACYVIPGDDYITVLKKLDSDFQSLETYTSLPMVSRLSIRPRRWNYFEWRAGNIVWNVTKEDNIIWGDVTKYEIHVCTTEGKLAKKIVKEHESKKIENEERDRLLIEQFGEDFVPSGVEFPSNYPAYETFSCDDAGRIFVRTWDRTEDGIGNYYDVFDSEGKYIARIPLRIKIHILKNQKLYSIEEDEEGYQVVKRYKVNWNI